MQTYEMTVRLKIIINVRPVNIILSFWPWNNVPYLEYVRTKFLVSQNAISHGKI